MVALDIINLMIPPLKATDDAHKAMVWMEEFRCNQLPVIDGTQLLGFVSEEIILEVNDIDKKVGEFALVGKT
ncbi:MAG: cbs domain containing protein, partial [Cyclobacteriaceae bacterium]